jgi:N-acetyl-alpha-D-muramate 1-phosphate uridylyltransferase
MQVAILAGGLGTRLMPLTRNLPKPMVPVLGRPFLEHQITLLQRHGATDIVLLVGHLGDAIRAYFGDGSRFGIRILYSDEGDARLDTAGAVKHAESLLDDAFMVLFGDSYLPVDYAQISREFLARGTRGMMVVYRNDNRFDTSDVAVEDGLVTAYQKYPPLPGAVYINYGLTLLKRETLAVMTPGQSISLQDFLQPFVREHAIAAWEATKRFFEIGSLAGLSELESHLCQPDSHP